MKAWLRSDTVQLVGAVLVSIGMGVLTWRVATTEEKAHGRGTRG